MWSGRNLQAMKKEANKSTYTIANRDFKAKAGKGWQGEKYVGKFRSGERKDNGECLVTQTEKGKLYTRNNLFRKQSGKSGPG